MPATYDQVLAEVNQIFRDVLDDNSIRLNYETNANDGTVKGWDSLSHIEIVVAIEKHFRIKFNFSDLQRFKNVGEMCDNIVTRLSKQ